MGSVGERLQWRDCLECERELRESAKANVGEWERDCNGEIVGLEIVRCRFVAQSVQHP